MAAATLLVASHRRETQWTSELWASSPSVSLSRREKGQTGRQVKCII